MHLSDQYAAFERGDTTEVGKQFVLTEDPEQRAIVGMSLRYLCLDSSLGAPDLFAKD